MRFNGLRIALVGPMPPPEGGMANQTRQLGELLVNEGARVIVVRSNAPCRPRWIGKVYMARAAFRLVPYVMRLWQVAGRVDLFHVMANSGWSWHLFAVPAVWIARLRGVPVVVNYRGGEAERFLERSAAQVAWTLRKASALAVPSAFLQNVFARRRLRSDIVPNVVDVERFRPARALPREPHVVVARNLEPIYDIATALRAFAVIRQSWPDARMSIGGSGPEERALRALAAQLGIEGAVSFLGRLTREAMAELYRSASLVLNPSRVDNMPNSVLEAMASGVPVVSTDVGGVPFVLRDGVSGVLVPPGDAGAMAKAALRILGDTRLSARLREAALLEVQQYAWSSVRARWAGIYAAMLGERAVEGAP